MKKRRLLSLFVAMTMVFSLFGAFTVTTEAASMKDEDFFAKLNYTAFPGLKDVKSAVDKRDYTAAKRALLEYYRKRTADGTVKAFDITEADANIGQAMLAKDFIITGPYEFDVWLDTVKVTSKTMTQYTAAGDEITKYLKKELDNKNMSIMLFERQKQAFPIFVASRESDNQPELVVHFTDGTQTSIKPDRDTFIHSGNKDTDYGAAKELEVKEQSDNAAEPFGSQTRRAYINFPLDTLAGKDIESAEIKLYARLNGNCTLPSLEFHIISVGNTIWDENKWTWNSTDGLGNIYSWQSSGDGPYWTKPTGSDSEYRNVALRFWYARPMVWEYLKYVKDPEGYPEGKEFGEKLLVLMNALTRKFDQTTGDAGRTIEFGERNNRWVDVLYNLLPTPVFDPEQNPDAADCFFNIINYMWGDMNFTRNNTNLGWSNWGAVYLAGMQKAYEFFPEFTNSDEWKAYNESRLIDKFKELYNDDMSFTESGPAYAIWCAELFGDAYRMGILNGNDIGNEYKSMLTYATRFAMECAYPNGYDTNIGDSNYRPRMDKFITLAAALGDPHITNYVNGGKEGTGEYLTKYYKDANSAYMRNSWNPDEAVYISYTNNPSNGHAHPDLNQVLMYAYGQPLLVDSGRVGYSGSPLYNEVRTAQAHNTIEAEGINMGSDKDHFHSNAKALEYTVSNDSFDFAEGSHSNFVSNNISHTRNVLFLHDGFAIVSDYVTGTTAKNYRQNWHFLPSSNAKAGNGVISTAFDGKANIVMASAGATADLATGVHSADYGLATQCEYGRFEKSGTAVKFNTILYPTRVGETADVSAEDLAQNDVNKGAAKFTVDGNTLYYYVKNTDSADGSFGDYTTDAKMAYASDGEYGLVGGKSLKNGESDIIASDLQIASIAVESDGSAVSITGESLTATNNKEQAIKIYAPDATTVTLNGESVVDFVKEGDYIYAVGVGSVTNIVENKIKATKDGFTAYNLQAQEVNEGKEEANREIIQAAISNYTARNAYMGFDLTGVDPDSFDKAVLRLTMVTPNGTEDMGAAGKMHLYFLNYNDPVWDRDSLSSLVLDESKMPKRTTAGSDAGFTGYDYRTEGDASGTKAEGDVFEVDFTKNLKDYLKAGKDSQFTLAMISESGSRKFASINSSKHEGPTFVLTVKETVGEQKETKVNVTFTDVDGATIKEPAAVTEGLSDGKLYTYPALDTIEYNQKTYYLDKAKSDLSVMIAEGGTYELKAVYAPAAEVEISFVGNDGEIKSDSVTAEPGSYSYTPELLYTINGKTYLTDMNNSLLTVKTGSGEKISVALVEATLGEENLITNGDFSNGAEGWTNAENGGNYVGTISDSYVHGNGKSLTNSADSKGGSTASVVRRFVPIEEGKSYYLSFYAYNTGGVIGTNSKMSAFVPVKGSAFGSFDGIIFKDYAEYGGQNSWSPEKQSEVQRDRYDMPYSPGMNHKEYLFTVPYGLEADNLMLSMFGWTGAGILYFSDFELREVESDLIPTYVTIKHTSDGAKVAPTDIFRADEGDNVNAADYVVGPIWKESGKLYEFDAEQTGSAELAVTKGYGNVAELKYSVKDYDGILLDLSFDDEADGFAGGLGKAEIKGGGVTLADGLVGNAASFANSGWLNAVMADGSSLLANVEELTITYYNKVNDTNTNWPFFASNSGNNFSGEENKHYLGAFENGGKLAIQRYNDKERPAAPEASGLGTDWKLVAVVVKSGSTELYIDGKLVKSESSKFKLADILGLSPVLQIGKANWGSGEYYNGLIDEFRVYDRAMTGSEIDAMVPAAPEIGLGWDGSGFTVDFLFGGDSVKVFKSGGGSFTGDIGDGEKGVAFSTADTNALYRARGIIGRNAGLPTEPTGVYALVAEAIAGFVEKNPNTVIAKAQLDKAAEVLNNGGIYLIKDGSNYRLTKEGDMLMSYADGKVTLKDEVYNAGLRFAEVGYATSDAADDIKTTVSADGKTVTIDGLAASEADVIFLEEIEFVFDDEAVEEFGDDYGEVDFVEEI